MILQQFASYFSTKNTTRTLIELAWALVSIYFHTNKSGSANGAKIQI